MRRASARYFDINKMRNVPIANSIKIAKNLGNITYVKKRGTRIKNWDI